MGLSEWEGRHAVTSPGNADHPASRPCPDLYEDRSANGNALRKISPGIRWRGRFLPGRCEFRRRHRVQHIFVLLVLSDRRVSGGPRLSCQLCLESAPVPHASEDCPLTASPLFHPLQWPARSGRFSSAEGPESST